MTANIALKPTFQRFADYILAGMTQTEAYQKTHPKCSPKACESKGARLVRNGKIAEYINNAVNRESEKTYLSREEKRQFLADIVRKPVGELNRDSPLCETFEVTSNAQGTREVVKMMSKASAIQIDNKMMGHEAPTEHNVIIGIAGILNSLNDTTGLPGKNGGVIDV